MSINAHPGKDPLAPPPPRSWGVVAPENQTAVAVRFVLTDRSVSFPVGELRRWEHVAGNPETLTINAGRELVTVEGQNLADVRAALDEARLRELRTAGSKSAVRAGPQVHRITIEPA